MPQKQHVVVRAAVSLLMIVGFYISGFVFMALMALMGFQLAVHHAGSAVKFVVIAFLGVGVAIIKGMKSLFVSHDFKAPLGIEVTRESHPQLVSFVNDLANEMQTKAPAHIYLTHDVNAAVTQTKGGLLSDSAPRVMIIGLPLMQALTQGELRSVLAHEFGHYIGGDTKLGAMTYRYNNSMMLTLGSLNGGLYRSYSVWYAKQAMKVSLKVRRNQELASDLASIHINGSRAHAAALQKVEVTGAAFDRVMGNYVEPVWRSGQQPENIFEALRSFMESPTRQEELDKIHAAALEAATDPYDSHPSLRDRVEIAQQLNLEATPHANAELPSLQLLTSPIDVERQMSDVLTVAALGHEPKAKISWAEAGEAAFAKWTSSPARALTLAVASVEGAESSVTLQRVMEAFARKQALPIALAIAGPIDYVSEEHRQTAAEEYIVDFLEALVVEALRERGCRYVVSWDGPLQLLSPASTVVEIEELVKQAVTGNVQPLINFLAQAGIPGDWRLRSTGDEPELEVGVDRAIGAIPNVYVARSVKDSMLGNSNRVFEVFVASDAIFVIDTGAKTSSDSALKSKKTKEREEQAVRERTEALFAMTPDEVRKLPNATRYALDSIESCKIEGSTYDWTLRLKLSDGSKLTVTPHKDLQASNKHVYDCIAPVLGSRLTV